MLAMNAHINRDFSFVLASAGLTAKDGTSHKPDHNAYNPRLDSIYKPVFAEEAKQFDPTFDDINVGPVDDEAVGAIMRVWREVVWRNAEIALAGRKPRRPRRPWRSASRTTRPHRPSSTARLFASSPAKTAVRDAYCHARHS